jgi:hypothetical protein
MSVFVGDSGSHHSEENLWKEGVDTSMIDHKVGEIARTSDQIDL